MGEREGRTGKDMIEKCCDDSGNDCEYPDYCDFARGLCFERLYRSGLKEGATAEREACASLADVISTAARDHADKCSDSTAAGLNYEEAHTAENIAKLIRARSE